MRLVAIELICYHQHDSRELLQHGAITWGGLNVVRVML